MASSVGSAREKGPRFPNGGLVLLVLFVALNAALLIGGGIKTHGDAVRYLSGAERLLDGRPFVEKEASYLGYVALVAACQWVGIGLPGVVAFQLLVAGVAALAIYDLGRQLGGRWAGLVTAGLLVGNPDIARWHSHVLTDSLYTSLVVLVVWSVHGAPRPGWRGYGASVSILLLAAFIRPNGWILFPVAALYWLGEAVPSRRKRWLASAGVLLLFAAGAALPAFRGGIQQESPEVMLRRGEVIWNYPPARLRMPPDPVSSTGWVSALGYGLRHPVACARLALWRVGTELAHTRPFYSRRHNLLVLLFLTPLYLLALRGWLRSRRQPLARLAAWVILSHLLIVALTFADWDGRFLLYVLPLMGLLAACSLPGTPMYREVS